MASERGFTIMELVVAMVFVGIVIVGLTDLFSSVRQVNIEANNYTIAVEAAQQLIEKFRNTPYPSISTGTTDVTSSALSSYPSLLSPRSATTTVQWVDASGVVQGSESGIKKVDVAISYKSRTGTQNVQLSTEIAEEGLNR
jgi:type II secretory pathway pseudopilin PulG